MLQDQIHNMDEYQAEAEKTAEAQAKASTETNATTLGDALAPVLNWEQSDAEFWLQVAQLLVLLAILYHVRRPTYGGIR